jgi:hypothetical protein
MRKAFSLGDAPYLFVPDNRSYERSSRLLFDEHNHPLDSTRLSAEEQKKYRWRRCYKMEFAACQPWAEFFLYGGVRLSRAKIMSLPCSMNWWKILYASMGVMKRLILDRGFLDAEKIGHCKRDLA